MVQTSSQEIFIRRCYGLKDGSKLVGIPKRCSIKPGDSVIIKKVTLEEVKKIIS